MPSPGCCCPQPCEHCSDTPPNSFIVDLVGTITNGFITLDVSGEYELAGGPVFCPLSTEYCAGCCYGNPFPFFFSDGEGGGEYFAFSVCIVRTLDGHTTLGFNVMWCPGVGSGSVSPTDNADAIETSAGTTEMTCDDAAALGPTLTWTAAHTAHSYEWNGVTVSVAPGP